MRYGSLFLTGHKRRGRLVGKNVHSAHQMSSRGSQDGLYFGEDKSCGVSFSVVCPLPMTLVPSVSIILWAGQESR